ncbi:MAG: ABC transporter permease [Rhodothermales bacterium]
MPDRFDLDHAIAAWRRPFEYHPAFSRDDLDELEGSLRDRVERLVERGCSPEDAFRTAQQRMGSYGHAETEYRKVYWQKLRSRGHFLKNLVWHGSMLKNYLLTAARNLRRKPGYSFINVLGLAVGVACCLLLLLYVRDELSYDRHHEHADSIYRVNMYVPGLGGEVGVTPTIVAPLMEREFPEVHVATRMEAGNSVIRAGDLVLDDNEFYFADSTFFQVFTHPFIHGDPTTALTRPNTVVLTASTAKRFFGDINPMGQTLVRNNNVTYEVTGVVDDVPDQSHYQFDAIASFASRTYWSGNDTWNSAQFFTYVRLHDATSAAVVKDKLAAYLAALRDADEEYRDLRLQPLTDIHLRSDVAYDLDGTGDRASVYALSTIALLVLLIACINYMNLATARSAQRAKEVGVRKALGAFRRQLVGQFFSESALLTVAGLALALGFVMVGLSGFNAISGKALTVSALLSPAVIGLVAGIFVLVSIVAGGYPALYLSRFQPVRVLRGQLARGRGASWLRQGLVVLQFGISAVLLVGMLVVMNQLRFISDQNLGFDSAHLVALPLDDPTLAQQHTAMAQAIQQHPSVLATTAVNAVPGQLGWTSELWGGPTRNDAFLTKGLPADVGLVDGLGLELLAGRSFPPTPTAPDSGAYQYILNEQAISRLGWAPEEAIGRQVAMGHDRLGHVIGIVKDFHFRSFHETIDPLAIWYQPNEVRHLIVRLAPGDPREAMAHLETVWQQFAPHRPFSYEFQNDIYDRLYRNEERLGQIVTLFASLALFVACLGLFGLASFTTEQRSREIGIRKVLGASVPGLVGLLSKDYVRLVLLAFVLALPLAWLGIGRWLDTFAYRVPIGPGLFVLAAGLSLTVALAAVGYQSVRAATIDPVRSLRSE